jgi:hypothetical protein
MKEKNAQLFILIHKLVKNIANKVLKQCADKLFYFKQIHLPTFEACLF